MAIEKRARGQEIERAKERDGIDRREEERDRGPKRPERWSDQARGGKTTPRIIAFLSPRKEDRVIYNDTLGSSNGTAIGVMYAGIRFNGIRSASIAGRRDL